MALNSEAIKTGLDYTSVTVFKIQFSQLPTSHFNFLYHHSWKSKVIQSRVESLVPLLIDTCSTQSLFVAEGTVCKIPNFWFWLLSVVRLANAYISVFGHPTP